MVGNKYQMPYTISSTVIAVASEKKLARKQVIEILIDTKSPQIAQPAPTDSWLRESEITNSIQKQYKPFIEQRKFCTETVTQLNLRKPFTKYTLNPAAEFQMS